MSWWKRVLGSDPEPGTPPPAPPVEPPAGDPGDDPAQLRAAIDRLVGLVNRNAGQLGGAAVVNARALLDTLGETVAIADDRPLDVYTAIAVRTTLEDYLPTTLRTFLAVDPALRAVPRPSGHSAAQSLLIQIDTLQRSAEATLEAARTHDVDALLVQGRFLSTRFSGSDLDLP